MSQRRSFRYFTLMNAVCVLPSDSVTMISQVPVVTPVAFVSVIGTLIRGAPEHPATLASFRSNPPGFG
jgi:hypothetical protein